MRAYRNFPYEALKKMQSEIDENSKAISDVEETSQKSVIDVETGALAWATGGKVDSSEISDMAYGDGKFVVVSSKDSAIYYSTDAINWHRVDIGIKLIRIIYGGGRFIGVSNSAIYYSTDMVNWNICKEMEYGYYMYGLAYGNNTFVAVGGDMFSMRVIYYSTDGDNWIEASEYDSTGKALWEVAYGNGKFVTISDNGETWCSTDGINWIFGDIDASGDTWAITYGKGKFVVVGYHIHYSTDGINWTKAADIDEDLPLYYIAYGDDMFVAVGTNTIGYSTDGVNWTFDNSVKLLDNIVYGNDKFVAIGGTRDIGYTACYTTPEMEQRNLEEVIRGLVDGSETTFKELSYADYQAGNYEKDKAYAIPDFPNGGNGKNSWLIFGSSGYLPEDDNWVVFNTADTSSITEVDLVLKWYGNVIQTMIIPIEYFRRLFDDGNRVMMYGSGVNAAKVEVKYVSSTQIAVRNVSKSTYIAVDVYATKSSVSVNTSSDTSPYSVPLVFKAHGSNAVALAHIPQNKTNVKITQCINHGVADYVGNCTIDYNATTGFVQVICSNTSIIDKLAYGTFTWD